MKKQIIRESVFNVKDNSIATIKIKSFAIEPFHFLLFYFFKMAINSNV